MALIVVGAEAAHRFYSFPWGGPSTDQDSNAQTKQFYWHVVARSIFCDFKQSLDDKYKDLNSAIVQVKKYACHSKDGIGKTHNSEPALVYTKGNVTELKRPNAIPNRAQFEQWCRESIVYGIAAQLVTQKRSFTRETEDELAAENLHRLKRSAYLLTALHGVLSVISCGCIYAAKTPWMWALAVVSFLVEKLGFIIFNCSHSLLSSNESYFSADHTSTPYPLDSSNFQREVQKYSEFSNEFPKMLVKLGSTCIVLAATAAADRRWGFWPLAWQLGSVLVASIIYRRYCHPKSCLSPVWGGTSVLAPRRPNQQQVYGACKK